MFLSFKTALFFSSSGEDILAVSFMLCFLILQSQIFSFIKSLPPAALMWPDRHSSNSCRKLSNFQCVMKTSEAYLFYASPTDIQRAAWLQPLCHSCSQRLSSVSVHNTSSLAVTQEFLYRLDKSDVCVCVSPPVCQAPPGSITVAGPQFWLHTFLIKASDALWTTSSFLGQHTQRRPFLCEILGSMHSHHVHTGVNDTQRITLIVHTYLPSLCSASKPLTMWNVKGVACR